MNDTISNSTRLLNLTICGSDNTTVTASQVEQVITPNATNSWRPISHELLINHFREQMGISGLTVLNEHHTLARHGQRYFGLFQIGGISRKHDEIGTVIGLRNSHDKSCPAGICAGDAPFVCSNLIFNNEIVIGRRHTTNILRDLAQLVARAIGGLMNAWVASDNRIDAYKAYQIANDTEAYELIAHAYRTGAISKTMIGDVIDQWHTPEHECWQERTMWGLSNAFTAVLRGNLTALPKRSDALYSVLDTRAGLGVIKQADAIALN